MATSAWKPSSGKSACSGSSVERDMAGQTWDDVTGCRDGSQPLEHHPSENQLELGQQLMGWRHLHSMIETGLDAGKASGLQGRP